MFCDNEVVYKKTLTPASTLKKKNVIIFYHKGREAVASGVAWIAKDGMTTNSADLFNKMLVQILDVKLCCISSHTDLFENW